MSKKSPKIECLISECGEMWPRNDDNIGRVPRKNDGGKGVYILFDGSTPVYVGRGNLHNRISKAKKSTRRGNSWDHFSWYVMPQKQYEFEIEALLLRMLPSHLRMLNQQRGKLPGLEPSKFENESVDPIVRPHSFGGRKKKRRK